MFRPASRLLLLAALVLSVVVPGFGRVPAASATHTGDVVVVTRHTRVAPSQRSTAVIVNCPDQTQAVGVGVSFATGLRSLRLRGSGLSPKTRLVPGGVNIILQNAGSVENSVAVYALCLRATAGVTYPAESRTVASGTIANQAAGCPSGTRRIGGAGWAYSAADSDFTLPVFQNYPFDGGWAMTVDNRFTRSTTAGMYVQASCATRTALGDLRPQDVAKRSVVVAGGSRLTTFVACPSGAEVAAGGFILPPSNALILASSRPTVSGGREGWEVEVLNRNTQQSEKFDALAVCLGLLPLVSSS